MARNISPQEAAQRLASAGFNNADRYEKGVQGKGNEWESGAVGAEDNWATGVSRAVSEKAFGKGVRKAGGNRYQEAVTTKGVQNWPTGMQQAESRYLEGIQPFTSLWDAALKTPRGPKGSPANLNRMTENVKRFQDAAK